MSDSAKWYVVHTYSGYENKVAATIEKAVENRKLENLIHAVKVPTDMETEVDANNQEKEVERKLFPGYVLVKMVMTDESWHIVRNTRGVTGFVGPGSKPVALTDDEVANLGMEHREAAAKFEEGESVKIIDGPLEGHIGRVDEVDAATETIYVVVSMFGRDTPVELNMNQVEKID